MSRRGTEPKDQTQVPVVSRTRQQSQKGKKQASLSVLNVSYSPSELRKLSHFIIRRGYKPFRVIEKGEQKQFKVPFFYF